MSTAKAKSFKRSKQWIYLQLLADVLKTPKTRILVARLLTGASLMIAAALIGVLNYNKQTRNQVLFAEGQYDSITSQALDIMVASFGRMNTGSRVFQQHVLIHNSNASLWPNQKIEGFYQQIPNLAAVSSVDNFFMAPVVTPEQAPAFEAFMQQYFFGELFPQGIIQPPPPGFPGPLPPLGKIFALNPMGNFSTYFYHWTDGIPFWGSPNRVLDPCLQVTFSADLGPWLLGYATRSDPRFGITLDASLQCVAASGTVEEANENCALISDVVPLPPPSFSNPMPEMENMQAFIVTPVALPDPDNGGRPKLVASATAGVNWKTLLGRAIPKYVDGIDCVVKTDSAYYTYALDKGEPLFLGRYDAHDPAFSKYARSVNILEETTITRKITEYELTIYPRAAFFEVYVTDTPLITSIGAAAIVIFCAFVFIVYSVLIENESGRKEFILDTKRRFVRFISHEIRTPLNTVKLGLKLLEMELESMRSQVMGSSPANAAELIRDTLTSWLQLVDDILGNSESAVDVLNDLLNYDKIEMGTLRLEYSSVGIWSLTKKTCAAFVMQAKQKNIDLQVIGECYKRDISTEDLDMYERLRVIGDSTRIAQVLRNLLSNALKFTPDRGLVTVTVQWVQNGLPNAAFHMPLDQIELLEDPRDGSIRVSVKDSGAGLSPQQLSEICCEGVQFNANQLQSGGGSGLGLFISKGLAEQHGGSLTVQSEGLGKGATFVLELPLFRNEQDMTAFGSLRSKPASSRKSHGNTSSKKRVIPLAVTLAGGAAAAGSFAGIAEVDEAAEDSDKLAQAAQVNRKKRVLVVDDATSNRKLLMRILTAKGYIADGCEDGLQAVNLYTSLRKQGEIIDAILMDYEMPVMDGPTATKKIRELGCNCFIVGVTGNVLSSDIDFFKAHGANAVIAKPLSVETFESMFRAYKHVPDQNNFETLATSSDSTKVIPFDEIV